MGSNLTGVLCAGSKLTYFSVGIEIDLFFVHGVRIYFVFVCWPKLLVFDVWIEIDLVFLCGTKMTWF